jgi:hypothetical protein
VNIGHPSVDGRDFLVLALSLQVRGVCAAVRLLCSVLGTDSVFFVTGTRWSSLCSRSRSSPARRLAFSDLRTALLIGIDLLASSSCTPKRRRLHVTVGSATATSPGTAAARLRSPESRGHG